MEQKNKPYISVIIPALNESNTIIATVNKIAGFFTLHNLSYEIIVVDDGSTDGTGDILRGIENPQVCVITHEKNQGKGAAVRSGMLNASGEYRLFIDADLQIPITHYLQAQQKFREGADVVITSAQVELSQDQFFSYRYYFGRFSKWLIRFVMQWPIRDSQRGFKLFSARAAERIFPLQQINRWGFDIEVLAIARSLDLSVGEISVQYREAIQSRVSLWSYMQTLRELILIRLRAWRGIVTPKEFHPGILLGFGILSLSIFVPLFLFNQIVSDGDAINVFYSNASAFQRIAETGWNSNLLFGFPSMSSFQIGFFSPLYRASFAVLDFISAFHFILFFSFATGAWLSYVFGRRIGLSTLSATFMSVVYTLSQANIHWLGNSAVVSTIPLLPAAFLAIQDSFGGGRKYAFIFSIFLGLTLTGGHYQFTLLALCAAGVYGLFLLSMSSSHKKRGVITLGVALCIGIAIGALQLQSIQIFTPLTTRIGGLDYTHATIDAATPLDFIKFILPNFSFRYGVTAEFLPYIGFLPFVLLLVALMRWKDNRSSLPFVIIFFGALLLTLQYSPLFWLFHQLPILEYFRGPARWTFVANFIAAVLAGYGFDSILSHGKPLLWEKKWFQRIPLGAIIAVIVANGAYAFWGSNLVEAVQRWFDSNWYTRTTGLEISYYHQVIEGIVNNSFDIIRITNLDFLIPLLSIYVGFLCIRILSIRSRTRFGYAVLVFSLVNLLGYAYATIPFRSVDFLRTVPEAVQIIQQRESDKNTYRTFSFLIGDASSKEITAVRKDASLDGVQYTKDGIIPNTNQLWNIAHADGYEPMASWRTERMLAFVGSEVNQFFPSLANAFLPLQKKLDTFVSRMSLLSMLNIKYLVTPYELPSAPHLVRIATPLSTRFRVPIMLYENTAVLPRIYFASSVKFLPITDEIKNFELVTDPKNDFSKVSLIECLDCKNPGTASHKDTLAIQEYRDGYLKVSTNTASSRWLIFSESNLPGWRFTVDGQPTTSFNANYLFHGILLPQGAHELVGEYGG